MPGNYLGVIWFKSNPNQSEDHFGWVDDENLFFSFSPHDDYHEDCRQYMNDAIKNSKCIARCFF